MHVDDFVGVGDLHALRERLDALIFQCLQDRFAAADQHDLAAEVLCGLDRTQRDLLGGMVAAHGVYEYSHSASSCAAIRSMIASERFAMARFLLAFPFTRWSSGVRMPKFTFMGWNETTLVSEI